MAHNNERAGTGGKNATLKARAYRAGERARRQAKAVSHQNEMLQQLEASLKRAEAAPVLPTISESFLKEMKVAELKQFAFDNGISISGRKAEILAAILSSDKIIKIA